MARTKYKNVREFISLFIFLYTVPPERLLYIYIYICRIGSNVRSKKHWCCVSLYASQIIALTDKIFWVYSGQWIFGRP
jgi:hypothetical protein